MMLPRRFSPARLAILATAVLGFLFFLTIHSRSAPKTSGTIPPLVRQHILEHKPFYGGRYYIPPSWLEDVKGLQSSTQPTDMLEAAELALELSLRKARFIEHSKIPLIVHQTWKSMDPTTWRPDIRESVEDWLRMATNEAGGAEPEMAYMLWDDDGFEALFKTYEAGMYDQFDMLPYKVMKADTFRVAVLRWFGGVYADVDTEPLKHPYHWVKTEDLEPWTDKTEGLVAEQVENIPSSYVAPPTTPSHWTELTSGITLSSLHGIGAILGIECDSRPDRDDFWRMGYSYPVQLTNWAMAMAPHHPIGAKSLAHLVSEVKANITRLAWIDPLDLTGPPALTGVVKSHTAEVQPSVRFEGVTGLDDPKGGRGKVVAGDVLILPITGFSPGRGWHNNMGSQPVTHENALVHHEAAGSWRHKDFKVEVGKLCRTFFGGCRNWSKIPDPDV